MQLLRRDLLSRIAAVAIVATAGIFLNSCDSAIYDDLDPCEIGLKLRFVYTYNMEDANAFPSQVDCLTLLVYDQQGKYVTTVTETDSTHLSDEMWRMELPLEPGKYILETWGGMQCDQTSFHFNAPPASQPLQSLQVGLNRELLTSPRGKRLHPLFFGQLSVEVPEESTSYTEATVKMMKDTNNIRILLQNLNGDPADGEDFVFTITDDNTLLSYDNLIVPQDSVVYYPWATGTEIAGVLDNGETAQLAYAELSTSRLMANSTAKLHIQRASDGQTVLSIPLVRFLLMLKSQEFDWLGPQEFLDRESRWNMIFFIQNGIWLDTYIKINDWVVRINDVDFYG